MGETVSKFANEVILPKAREMDEAEAMDPAVVEQLFEQGLMGIEIPEEYGGSGMNFTSAIIAIEELARVDPSVSVMCDVHNTLVNTAIIKWGSQRMKKEWLPRLATKDVGRYPPLRNAEEMLTRYVQAHSVCLSPSPAQMLSPSPRKRRAPSTGTRSMVVKCG
jgi:hypothetical protein